MNKRGAAASLKSKGTAHSTIFDIPMRPMREDQTLTTFFQLKTVHHFRNGNYSFEFCSLHAGHA